MHRINARCYGDKNKWNKKKPECYKDFDNIDKKIRK